jgi:hypothetical protein
MMTHGGSGIEEDISNLIEDDRMVCNQRIVRSLSDFNKNSFRILDRPLPDLVVDDLKAGSWTVTELSEKYGVIREDIDEILLNISKNSLYFIDEHKYIPRRVGRDERPGKRVFVRYSLIPIPIHARIFDVTLGMSLLGWDEKIRARSNIIREISPDNIIDDYSRFTSDYWRIPLDKVSNYFSGVNVYFIMSRCGPLPLVSKSAFYQKIRENLSESPEFLRYEFTNMDFERFKQQFYPILTEGVSSFSEIQYAVLQLSDALNYQRSVANREEVDDLERINEELFEMLFVP